MAAREELFEAGVLLPPDGADAEAAAVSLERCLARLYRHGLGLETVDSAPAAGALITPPAQMVTSGPDAPAPASTPEADVAAAMSLQRLPVEPKGVEPKGLAPTPTRAASGATSTSRGADGGNGLSLGGRRVTRQSDGGDTEDGLETLASSDGEDLSLGSTDDEPE